MNLRLRLTLVVAVTFALVVVGCTYAAHVSARSRLRAETDQFLLTRADRFAHTPGNEFPQNGGDGDEAGGAGGGPSLSDPDAVVQILDSKGRVHSSIAGQPAIPIDSGDRVLAEHGGASRFRDVTVKGVEYRVLTVALTGGGAAQIARSIEGDHDVLATLDARLTLIAVIGTLIAASMAWAIARRTVKPIEDLTRKATYVAETQDLANPIPIARRDELGRLASSFNTMLEALNTSREQQKRLVLDASHELRTPLTALRTNIDLLRRARSFDADQRAELLTEADLELRELTDLVAELVELATDTRSEEPVDQIELSELVDRVVTRHRRRSGREINVEMNEPAVVNGRVALLERAVSNLVENALKFSADDTAISVVVDGSRIEVLDRGAGIAPADLPHVFDRFYRATAARTLPGSGLGLAIVEQIAQLHDGTITLGPRVGGGTIARLELPAVAPGG
ncbi:MAG: two-component system, OmpR family, sensor histidine kinase MprB [Actinomycetota bacterium]|jgi:two-component system sensor histidine kinase MprB|nr:two-component system, OmpR family, sensor histidine kinase MprB [Actinomycetota bacterium]